MIEVIFYLLKRKLDPDNRICLLKSSNDPELAAYYQAMGSCGSTDLDGDTGRIYVKIHDIEETTKGTWFEEFVHALQFLKYGNIPLSHDNLEMRTREIEAADCLLKNADRLRLNQQDRDHCRRSIEYYGGDV